MNTRPEKEQTMNDELRTNQALFASAMVFDQNRLSVKFERGDNGEMKRSSFTVPNGAETAEDGSMCFSFPPVEAEKVTVEGNCRFRTGKKELERGEDGFWRARLSLDEMEPAGHVLHFSVNGVPTLNPRVPIGCGSNGAYNYAEQADAEQDFILLKDVPHGTVRMNLYKSAVCGNLTRAAWVYTPPAYEKDKDRRYPVWYLHHGGGENESAWIWQGKINLIMDNMIAAGECEEMIVVMNATDTYAPTQNEDVFTNVEYCDVLVKDCIPYIDRNYRTIPDRDHRAVAGLSFGVVHSFMSAFRYPDFFSWLGCFSGHIRPFSLNGEYFGRYFDYTDVFRNKELFNQRYHLVFHGGGFDEGFGKRRVPVNEGEFEYDYEKFKAEGYNVDYCGYDGGHEWRTFRFSAREFASRLFK